MYDIFEIDFISIPQLTYKDSGMQKKNKILCYSPFLYIMLMLYS